MNPPAARNSKRIAPRPSPERRRGVSAARSDKAPAPGPVKLRAIHRALSAWYRRHARDLPWRQTRDPYRIWLAEILLQQTRVETATPYYERFVKRFPTVRDLADAALDDVLRLWAGLGYYARARNLHKAARIVAGELRGELPRNVAELQELPGVGRYTAGAIASIAFEQRAAVLDGNVKRVLARLFAIDASLGEPSTVDQLWSLADSLLPRARPGQFNQALMELGARVCVPKNPACLECPLRTTCVAAAQDTQNHLPRRRQKRAPLRVQAVAGAIRHEGRCLVVKRPLRGLLGGLWRLPAADIQNGEDRARRLRRHLRELLGSDVSVGCYLGSVKHAFSHRLLELHVYRCGLRAKRAVARTRGGMRWIRPMRPGSLPLSSLDRKALALL